MATLQETNVRATVAKRLDSGGQREVRTRLRVSPTREGVNFAFLALFVLVGAIIRNVNLLVMLGGVLMGIMFLQWRFGKRSLVGLHASRRQSRFAYAREPFEITIELENRRHLLPAWAIIANMSVDYIEQDRPVISAYVRKTLPSMSAKTKQSTSFQLKCNRRGKYEISTIELSTTYPFNLTKASRYVWKKESFMVLPAIGRLTKQWKELFEIHPFGSRKKFARSGANQGEFYGLRDYVSGDSPRIIHWRSVARLNKLVVRQFERQESQQISVILDLYREQGDGLPLTDDQADRVDRAIEFLSTLAKQLVGRGQVTLNVAVTSAASFTALSMQNPNQINELLTLLATAESSKSANVHRAGLELAPILNTSPRLLIISTRPNNWSPDQLDDELGASKIVLQRASMRWLNVSNNEESEYFVRQNIEEDANRLQQHPSHEPTDATSSIEKPSANGPGVPV